MPTKLKNLKITKVDFVEEGANPNANIMLYKSRDGNSKGGTKSDNVFSRLLSVIAKTLGVKDDQVEQAITEITKEYEASTFNEKIEEQNLRKIAGEIWDVSYALEESLNSIVIAHELDAAAKTELLKQSLNEFAETVKQLIPKWVAGKTTGKINKKEYPMTAARLEILKEAKTKIETVIAKTKEQTEKKGTESTVAKNTDTRQIEKGEPNEMKFDKSKLTPEELAILESIEKKAGIQEDQANNGKGDAKEEDDIYKGLHPAVKNEIERLRKAADAAEDRELADIAKKYEIIGKKAEELVPLLKSLKAAGGDTYRQMISVLDAGVEMAEKSGIFKELGKKGAGERDAWTAIERHADDILKAMPNLNRTQAIAKACEQHPELVNEYESNR